MRLLITGANGLLGSKLVQQAPLEHELIAMSRRPPVYEAGRVARWYETDLRDEEAVQAQTAEVQPEAVLHTAAMTDVDGCELHPEQAWAINVTATGHVARAAAETGAYLVLLSTDYVFSGDAGPYGESDPPGPALSVYGRTKLAAEALVAERCPGAGIARTSLLYGHGAHARPNFVTWLVGQLRGGQPVRVVTDQVGSPTLADNLAEMVLAMAERHAAGIFHTVGPDWVTRLEYAERVVACFSLDRALLTPIRTSDLQQPAARPAHSGLIVDRVERELRVLPVGLDEGLNRVRKAMGG